MKWRVSTRRCNPVAAGTGADPDGSVEAIVATDDTDETDAAVDTGETDAAVDTGDTGDTEVRPEIPGGEAPRRESREAPGRTEGRGDVSPPEIDPRLAERRREQQQAVYRRRRRVVIAIGSGLAVVLIAWLVARSSLFGIDSIEVRGTDRASAAAIRAAARVDSGAPLLDLDEAAVARRVEALPYVASASVHTEFPDTLVIEVTERQPVAWVQGRRTVALLDREGRVLERSADPPPVLPQIVGITAPLPPGETIEAANVLRGVGRFPAELLLRAGQVRYAPGRTSITLRGERPEAGEIRIGSFKRMEDKGAAAIAVLAELRRRGERVRYVDVRVPEAPATR